MVEGSCNETVLLGMEGLVVLSMTEEDGEIFVLVETTARLGCPGCGSVAVGHGRSVVQVRDLPIGGRPVRLVWKKRRGLCRDPDCGVRTFTETSELIEGSLTRRAAKEVCRMVGEDGTLKE